jgi:hypothetical protein
MNNGRVDYFGIGELTFVGYIVCMGKSFMQMYIQRTSRELPTPSLSQHTPVLKKEKFPAFHRIFMQLDNTNKCCVRALTETYKEQHKILGSVFVESSIDRLSKYFNT